MSKSVSNQTLSIYWQYIKHHKLAHIVLLITRPLYVIGMYIAFVYVAGNTLDKVIKGQVSGDFWHAFGPTLMVLVGIAAVTVFTEALSLRLIWTVQVKIENELYALCYRHLINQSAEFHADSFAGSLVNNANKFVGAFDRLHDTMYWNVYSLIITSIVALAILAPRLPLFTFLLFAFCAFYCFVTFLVNKRSTALNAHRSAKEAEATGHLADSLSNIMAIKSFAAEDAEKATYKKRVLAVQDAQFSLRDFALKKDSFLYVPIMTTLVLSVILSVIAVQRGLTEASTVLLAVALTRDMLMRVREFNNSVLRNITRSFGDSHDMTLILNEPIKVTDKANAGELQVDKGEVSFDHTIFKYQADSKDTLFEKLNFTVKPGEKVGLVGPSGGGKSTITKLLLRFMDIQGGAINIDGQNIANVTQASLRQAIGYVPQEPLLFHRSLFDNIRYGRPDATDEEVYEAAKKAHAHDFIELLPKGYETLVGERGVKLSGGQRQRVAIARTILKNAPILVLDEATSALDSESEVLIQQALWELMQDRTAIVIAHRLSTIQRMDRIIVLDNGNIVEEGTHHELLKRKGTYARLWAHQSGGFLED